LDAVIDRISGDFGSYAKDQLSLFDAKTLRRVLWSASLMIYSEDWLLNTIISLGEEHSIVLNQLHFEFLSLSGMRQFVDPDGPMSEEIGLSLFSRLKGECDADLQWRWFSRIGLSECGSALDSIRLLYCGNWDSFYSLIFHRKCDDFDSTLTLIQTSLHNIFGGYTACVWNSTLVDVFEDGNRSLFSH
jgi:hypothetical protein